MFDIKQSGVLVSNSVSDLLYKDVFPTVIYGFCKRLKQPFLCE